MALLKDLLIKFKSNVCNLLVAICLQCRRQETWAQKILWRRQGNPLQYSCLENSIDREAWQATVHGIAKSWTHDCETNFHKLVAFCR